MHGMIFAELEKYVEARHGAQVWEQLLEKAGLRSRVYLPVSEYADSEIVKLVMTAAEMTNKESDVIFEDFGQFIAPDLMSMYKAVVDPKWKTLDVIEHTEEAIHRVVRMKNPGARPPELWATRTSPKELVLRYSSERKMCALAKGIAKGVAQYYGERISIQETHCMRTGSSSCGIVIRLA
jgi:predicted hydrocarbon binding protein